MASGQDGGDLQTNLDSISKELMNIIAVKGEDNNVFDDQQQAGIIESSCNNNGNILPQLQYEFPDLPGNVAAHYPPSSRNLCLQPEAGHFNNIPPIEQGNSDQASSTPVTASNSDVAGEIIFDHSLNYPLPVKPFDLYDNLPSSPIAPLTTSQPNFANETYFHQSANCSAAARQPDFAPTCLNDYLPSSFLAAKLPDFADNLPGTSSAASNRRLFKETKINDITRLRQRKQYSTMPIYDALPYEYQLPNTLSAVTNSQAASIINGNGMCFKSDMSYSNILPNGPLNHKYLPSMSLAVGKSDFGATLSFMSDSITSDRSGNFPTILNTKYQTVPRLEIHYLPSKRSHSNVKNNQKKYPRNVRAGDNGRNTFDSNLPQNQKTLLHSSLKGAYRKVTSTDSKSDSTSNDNDNNNNNNKQNDNKNENGELIMDFNKFGWSLTCKEPNAVLRLFALLKDTHHAITEMNPHYRNVNMERAFQRTFRGPPPIKMPNTMNVQTQVKEVSRLIHIFIHEKDSILKLNQKYDGQLAIEYEDYLNKLRKLVEQFDGYKAKNLEHRFGQFITSVGKEQAEQLEILLKVLNREIRIVRTQFMAYDWFINVTYREKKRDSCLRENKSQYPYEIENENETTYFGFINEILGIVEKKEDQEIETFNEQQKNLDLLGAQQVNMLSDLGADNDDD